MDFSIWARVWTILVQTLGKTWTKSWVNLGQASGKPQAKPWANLRQTLGRPQADLGQTLGKPQAQPWADLGQTLGKNSGKPWSQVQVKGWGKVEDDIRKRASMCNSYSLQYVKRRRVIVVPKKVSNIALR